MSTIDLAAVQQSADEHPATAFVGPELPATSTAGGSSSTDVVKHSRPINAREPASIIEFMREIWPSATIRTRGDAIVCNGNEFARDNSFANRYTATISGVAHTLMIEMDAGARTRFHKVGFTQTFTDHLDGKFYTKSTFVDNKSTTLEYESGKLVRKYTSANERRRTVTYSPICGCGEHHVERIEIKSKSKSDVEHRNVKIFAPPEAPDAYTCMKLKHGRLASDYSYAGPNLQVKHGACIDYYVDETSSEVYDMGRCTHETREFTDAAGVVHCATVEHK